MDKPTSSTSKFKTRREILRRHRRERQVLFFGVLTVALGTVAFGAYSVYMGSIASPFSAPFVTKQGDFDSDVTLPCPPSGSLAMNSGEIVVRVFNGTDRSGLAAKVLTDLDGRGYYPAGASNWSRTYAGVARIAFGVEGVQQGYTVARNFPEYELVLDTREGHTVDIVMGELYDDSAGLVPLLDPALDPELPLSAPAECLNPRLIDPEPAPRTLPDDPFATPSPSATPTTTPAP